MTKQKWMEQRTRVSKEYAEQLGKLGVKGSKLKNLQAGFEDGLTNALFIFREAGELKLTDE